MGDQKTAQELLGQLGGKTVETMTVWADANQRMLRELVEFSAATAKEGVRLYAELQQGAIEALSANSVEKAFKALEGHAQAIARSAERLQTSADQAGKGIYETCTTVVARMRGVYSQN
jgi:hypothetical protein